MMQPTKHIVLELYYPNQDRYKIKLLVQDRLKPEIRNRTEVRELSEGLVGNIVDINPIGFSEVDGVRLKSRIHGCGETERLVLS